MKLPVRRKLPSWLEPHGGAAHWCLSRAALDYVRAFIARERRFVRFFKTVRSPDEFFFQTILMNSPLSGTMVNEYLWHTEWVPNTPHPKVLTERSYAALECSPKLFARKFDAGVDERILDAIDRGLLAVGGRG